MRKKVPEIRFREFEGEWELKKFGDVFEEYTEKNHADLPPLTIIQGKGTILRDSADRNLQYDKSNLINYNLVRKDDFILHLRSFEGGLEKANSEGIVSPAYHIFHGEGTVTSFYYIFFRSDYFINVLLKPHIYGVRDGKSIDIEEMKTIYIPVPSFDEQQKIGDYFSQLDTIITNAEERHKKLLALKKAMLQKMFPQEGESVPRVRFGEFGGEWETVLLKRIAWKVIERNEHRDYTETFTNSAEHGIISQREYFDHDISNADNINGYYIVAEDDFVYNPRISTNAPVGPINRNKLGRKGIMSPLYTVFRPHDVDCAYLEWFFKSRCWHTYMFYNGDNGARYDRFSIKDDVFFDMPIPLPCMKEQQKIGEYFDTLENAITAQEQKIEKLKQMKAALMQKMFI